MWLFFHFFGIFLNSFGSCQVISAVRPQPYPIHVEKTSNCCQYIPNSDELMKCLYSVHYKTTTEASLVTYVTKDIYDYAAYALAINSAYAEHNKYQFKILTPSEANYEPTDARWNKVKILEEAISNGGWAQNHHYVVWLDADLAILDLGMRIELIGQEYPDADIIMSEDLDAAATLGNSGYILVRNTPWAKQFLSQWWSHEDRKRMNDQASLTLLYHSLDTQQQRKIKILRKDAVNSYFPPYINQQEYNQVLHLAGDIQAYRRLVFMKGFQEICTALSMNPPHHIPIQLTLTRQFLALSTENMKGVRITELQTLLSQINEYQFDQRQSPQIHFSFIESILNRALDLQKGVYEEFSNHPIPLNSNDIMKFEQLKFEFYSLEVDILYWCYLSYKNITLSVNKTIPYLIKDNSSSSSLPSSENYEILKLNYHQAESLRQTMSIAYFLIDFHSTFSHYYIFETNNLNKKLKNIQIFKNILEELEHIILPELQKRLPQSDYHRGKYYEFKLYQFITGIYSMDNTSQFQQLINFYKKAIEVWRELHQLKYYGTTYVTIDPYKEGSRAMKYLAGLLCFESIDTYEEGILYYREAQNLMFLTLQGRYSY